MNITTNNTLKTIFTASLLLASLFAIAPKSEAMHVYASGSSYMIRAGHHNHNQHHNHNHNHHHHHNYYRRYNRNYWYWGYNQPYGYRPHSFCYYHPGRCW